MNIGAPSQARIATLGFDYECKVKFQPKKKPRVLSIDGGGVRGIIPASVLDRIEQATQLPICQLFDVFTATSTGTIITSGLNLTDPENPSKPKFSAAQLTEKYETLAQIVFTNTFWERMKSGFGLWGPKYSSVAFENILDEFFGDKKVKDLINPVWYPTGILQGYVASAFTKEHDGERPLKEVIRACTAAPTYFSSPILNTMKTVADPEKENQEIMVNLQQAMCDGGLFANNPVDAGMIYTKDLFGCGFDQCVYSLGTGAVQYTLTLKESQNMGLYQWASRILNSMFSLQSSYATVKAYKLIEHQENFFTINPDIDAIHAELDDASTANLTYLKDIAVAWFDDPKNNDIFENLCHSLTENYHLRNLNQ